MNAIAPVSSRAAFLGENVKNKSISKKSLRSCWKRDEKAKAEFDRRQKEKVFALLALSCRDQNGAWRGVHCKLQDLASEKMLIAPQTQGSRQQALCAGTCTRPQTWYLLVDFRVLPEVLVGVVEGGGCPPVKKPRFYASSAMLTL
jgi:hypothetical protein